jgi:hypothetical protein
MVGVPPPLLRVEACTTSLTMINTTVFNVKEALETLLTFYTTSKYSLMDSMPL